MEKRFGGKKPLVWAHRGASEYAPENTLPAFEEAVRQGADGVELDIHLTKDGELVVIHDEKINRTSNGKGMVKDMTLAELRRFNYNRKHPEVCDWAEIPTMREVFELLKPTGLTINIELKTGVVFYPGIEEKILRLTAEEGMEDRVIYSSFNHYSVLRLKELDPQAKTGFLYSDGPIDVPAYGKKYGVDALHPALYNLQYPGFMEDCRAQGLSVHVWTVNSPMYVRMCQAAGVDAIITNDPKMTRAMVDEQDPAQPGADGQDA